MTFTRAVFLIFAMSTLPVLGLHAQADECSGDRLTHLLRDTAGQDFRLTCMVDYRDGQLVGGMIGGDIVLSSTRADGSSRWKTRFATGSESTELTTLNKIIIDSEGMVAGIGSTFNDGDQRAYLFRYDPDLDRLLYLQRSTYRAEPGGLLESGDDYLVAGTRLDFPAPIFTRAYLQRFHTEDGAPKGNCLVYDLDGDERFTDLIRHPEGGYLLAGQGVSGSGAGSVRSSLTHLNDDGSVVSSTMGPVQPDVNARLLANDVEVIGDRIYLLTWGDIGKITGSINTSPLVTCFTLSGQALWTKRYDLTDYSGETAHELSAYRGGLLLYGYTLDGDRDPFLVSLSTSGSVKWAQGYPLPGRMLLYQRANQQLSITARGPRIVGAVTYNHPRPHEGLFMQLDSRGKSLSPCVPERKLRVLTTEETNDWSTYRLAMEEIDNGQESLASDIRAVHWEAYGACDGNCPECDGRRIERRFACPGDSVFLAGEWRNTAGLYTEQPTGARCDTLLNTVLEYAEPLEASYLQSLDCGLPTVEVTLMVAGGAPPYIYQWSEDSIKGDRPTLAFGRYSVTITDSLGCSPLPVEIDVERGSSPVTVVATPPSCPNGTDGRLTLLPPGQGSIKLLNDSTFSGEQISGLRAGGNPVVIKTNAGCEVFREAFVPTAEPLGVHLLGPPVVALGSSATFEFDYSGPDAEPATIDWSSDSCYNCLSQRLLPLSDTLIKVMVTDSRGCQASDSLAVRVESGTKVVYLPTAFSPNGDGQNDLLVPGFSPQVAGIERWQVYDRWGTVVWTYRVGSEAWWSGGDAGAGVYVYTLQLQLIDGRKETVQGHITLLR